MLTRLPRLREFYHATEEPDPRLGSKGPLEISRRVLSIDVGFDNLGFAIGDLTIRKGPRGSKEVPPPGPGFLVSTVGRNCVASFDLLDCGVASVGAKSEDSIEVKSRYLAASALDDILERCDAAGGINTIIIELQVVRTAPQRGGGAAGASGTNFTMLVLSHVIARILVERRPALVHECPPQIIAARTRAPLIKSIAERLPPLLTAFALAVPPEKDFKKACYNACLACAGACDATTEGVERFRRLGDRQQHVADASIQALAWADTVVAPAIETRPKDPRRPRHTLPWRDGVEVPRAPPHRMFPERGFVRGVLEEDGQWLCLLVDDHGSSKLTIREKPEGVLASKVPWEELERGESPSVLCKRISRRAPAVTGPSLPESWRGIESAALRSKVLSRMNDVARVAAVLRQPLVGSDPVMSAWIRCALFR
jgi:hypothetical protein